MSFKLLSLSAMYSGYLDSFYSKNSEIMKLSYEEHLTHLLEDSTEFVGSYIRNFRKLGIDASCIIANDNILQNKWSKEIGLNHKSGREILFEQVKLCNPDILWIENLSLIDFDWLTHVKNSLKNIKLIVGYHCAPFNRKVLNSLRGIDIMIACTPGLKSELEKNGKKSFLVYHGFDTDILSRITQENRIIKNDFIFSGSLISGGDFHSKRIKLIERIINENINIQLYVNLENAYKIRAKQSIFLLNSFLSKIKMGKLIGNNTILGYGKSWVDSYSDSLKRLRHDPVYGIEMLDLFRQSRIVLNYHIGVAGEYAGNMRMFEVTGAGSCLLTDKKKNMHDLFDTEREVVVYDGEDDCIEKVKWLLEHEEERKKIASAGNQKTLNSHTVENRCRLLIEILNAELKNKQQGK
jgi:spore maturation protein CgeB